MVRMKNFVEKDQRITREFDKYRLPPPSPDLHNRILRAAREAMASSDAELGWIDRWLQAIVSFRQEILAFASALMLILGVVMQLGGGQSVLADSIGRLTVMAAASGSLYRATSMDCSVLKPGAGDEAQYRVRWNTSGVTRVDMDSLDGTEQTLWISKGIVSAADYEGGTVRSMAITTMPSKWQPPMEYLTPAILAQHMKERYGLMHAERHDSAGREEFLLIGQENQQTIEIAIDPRTYLPITIKKYSPGSGRTGEQRHCLEEVRFQWNNPIPQELLVPGSSAVKRQVH
jgi:hypothetical protein